MRVLSYPPRRARWGKNTLVCGDNDEVQVPEVQYPFQEGDDIQLQRQVFGPRRTLVRLSPTEIIEYLLKMPPDTIPGALARVAGKVVQGRQAYDLSVIPEIQRQLTAGAVAVAEAGRC